MLKRHAGSKQWEKQLVLQIEADLVANKVKQSGIW